MKIYHADMYAESLSSSPSWLDKLAACCSPPSPGFPPDHGYGYSQNKLSRRNDKETSVWSDAPRLTPPPSSAPHPRPVELTGNTSARQLLGAENSSGRGSNSSNGSTPTTAHSKKPFSRSRHGYSKSGSSTLIGTSHSTAGRGRSHSLRRRPHTSSSLSLFPLPSALSSSSAASRRRPQISAPTNFRHLHSGTFVFPELPQDQQQQIQQFQQQQQQQQLQQEEQQLQLQQEEVQGQQQQFQQQYLQHYAQQYRQQYQQQFQRRPPSFQPLNFTHLPSPLTSSFQRATGEEQVQIPPRVHTRDGSHGSQDSQPALDRSYSAMSFHLPRRPVGGSASSIRAVSRGNPSTAPAPVVPQKSRLRSHSSPSVDNIVERIAGAMLEVEKLQAEIDSVIERQSIYVSSRPSTAYGMLPGTEYVNLPTADAFDMPEMPAMPAAAPSFAERLSTDRPRTAPPRSSSLFPGAVDSSSPSSSFGTSVSNTTTTTNTAPIAEAASVASAAAKATKAKAKAAAATIAAANANASASSLQGSLRGGGSVSGSGGGGSRINGRLVDVPLAPPLPLVLRPPLRKKKSFSRVSTWLSFHHNEGGAGDGRNAYTAHDRGLSFDSVTNAPRPITANDGFYQCMVPADASSQYGLAGRTSMDSLASTVDTLSTWTTERDMAERRRADGCGSDDVFAPGTCHQFAETSTPTSATTTATIMTYALANATAMTTPTMPAVVGVPGFIPVVAASTMAEKSSGLIAPAHRPQSVGVAF